MGWILSYFHLNKYCAGIISNRAVTILMFRWSSFVLNPEPASDVIGLEESGNMSLDDSVNQLSNVIDLAT